MEGPMRARVEEFDDLCRCIDECFPTETSLGGMAARWPHCLQRTPEHTGQYLVLKEGGRIVACLSCVDETLVVEGGTLRSGGIGQVSTLNAYRGKGLMTQLLEAAIRRMEGEGYAISDLGGDRVRYGRFGWEPAGRWWNFTVTPRSAREHMRPTGYEVRRVTPSEAEMAAILRMHDAEPRRMARGEQKNRDLLNRLGKEVWVVYAGGEVAGYGVTFRHATSPGIHEFGGSREALHALAAEVVGGGEATWTLSSPWTNAANGLWTALASSWRVAPIHQVRIVDLYRTLKAFEFQMSERVRRIRDVRERRITIAIAETGQSVSVRVSADGVEVGHGGAAPADVTLPRRDAVRLLFGPGTPEAAGFGNVPRELAEALPLDWAMWHNEMV